MKPRVQQLWFACLLLFALSLRFQVGAATCVSAPGGLVGWWPGDGNANDLAGTNNGALQGGATATATGWDGSAFSFDGTNGYVQFADSAVFHPTNLTIEAWVRFSGLNSAGNAPAGLQYIVFKQNTRSSVFEGFAFTKTRSANLDYFDFQIASSSGQTAEILSVTAVTTNTWYHVACVRGSNFIQIYVNGALEKQAAVAFAQDYGALPLFFGTSGQSSWDRKLKGTLDEVSLYKRALSSNEISAIYQAGAAGKCKAGTPPTIGTQPQGQTVVAGSNATFTVAATGSPPLFYQWQFGGASLGGATNSTLTLTNVQPANAGDYSVVVTGTGGAVTSTVATLTVLVPPGFTAQPQSVTNLTGTMASFSAIATGTAPLNYQWQQNGANLTNSGRVSGATSNVLAISGVQAADAGVFTLAVSNAAGVATSAPATLTVSGPPVITVQPVNQSVATGSTASFSVTAAGSQPLSYQWRKDGQVLTDGGNRSGATSAALTLAMVQTNDAGGYQVVISNSLNSVTSVVAVLMVAPAPPPAGQGAGAVVLVNSHSAKYSDFQHFIQPYLDNFGIPYTVQDISTNAPGAGLGSCAVIIIGHSQLDTNQTYLTSDAQASISLAVSNGTGLVNFDNNLAVGTSPRYSFVQSIFGFTYGSSALVTNVLIPPTEPSSQMHYVTARHPTNDLVSFRTNMSLPGITVPVGATTLASAGGKPLVVIKKFGQGRALQWGSYDWMVSSVLGPADGLDDVLWRGFVWAARKPFVMRGMPNFVSMRVDDAVGPFGWVHDANAIGFKPFVAVFYLLVSNAAALDLGQLATSGKATASIHSTDRGNAFFYYDYGHDQPWPDNVMSNNFRLGTQWHTNHGIPISKVCATHYSAIGWNAFPGLKAWGMEYIPIEIVPQTVEYGQTPPTPWLVGGPFRLYETPKGGEVNWPTYYADWFTVQGHPELDGWFFNYYSEMRDITNSCHEWCPDNNVAGSVSRGTAMIKRTLDSMVLTTLFTHEWYISPIYQDVWQAILQGITNNLASYHPIFVTLDYISQYARALRTSRVVSGDYDPVTGKVTATFSGKTDLDIFVCTYVGADSSITNSSATVPVFTGSLTTVVGALPPQGIPPSVITPPASITTNAGATAVFSVTAGGTVPLSYQWFLNGTALAEGNQFSGTTGSMLTLSNVQPAEGGDYQVVAGNVLASATSSVATLTVLVPPSIITPPASVTTNAGATAIFSETAGGTTPLTYQWFLNDIALSEGSQFSGTTSSTLTLTDVQPVAAGDYRVVAGNVLASATSSVATLTVLVPPSIITPPASVTTNAGATVVFSVTAGGTTPLTYQWFLNGTALADGSQFSGTTSSTLTLSNVQPAEAGDYRVVASNVLGSATSSVATLSVLVPPSVTAQPTNRAAPVGATVSFSVAAAGTAPLSFQWQFNGTNLDGAVFDVLMLTNVQPEQSGAYLAAISNPAGTTNSIIALLTVVDQPVLLNARMSNGAFVFTLNGVAGQNYLIDVSTNLPDWTLLATVTNAATQTDFTDPTSSNTVSRFYRARWVP